MATPSQDKSQHGPEHPAVGHEVGPPILLATTVALIVLTILTVAVALAAREHIIRLGEYGIWVAMGIATVKAALVCMFFMHLRYDRPFNGIVLLASLLFLLLFVGLSLQDTASYKGEIDWQEAQFYSRE